MTIGSLFSGIGGLDLGLEQAGLGPVIWQIEADPYRREILRRHWSRIPIHHDVRRVGAANLARPAIVCGGFPCQDVSSAGARAGLGGDRSGLWREFERVVGELLPEWVVVENVASGAKLWVDEVRGDLEWLGYESFPVPLSASDLGAPHRRARIFLVARLADAYAQGEHVRARWPEVAGAPEPVPDADGIELRAEPGRCGGMGRGDGGGDPAEPVVAGWWPAEPDVDRVAHGIPNGMDRNAALGDAVVPPCAEVIGWIVREFREERR